MKNHSNLDHLLQLVQSSATHELVIDQEAIKRAYEDDQYQQSLTIKLLSIFGGILASITFLGFLMLLGFNDSGATLLTLGVFATVGAVLINKNYSEILLDTISVSTFIIGFLLVGYGLHILKVNENMICVAYIFMALCTLIVLQNYILSLCSTLIVHGSIISLIFFNNASAGIHIFTITLALITTYLFLHEGRLISLNKIISNLYRPVKTACVLALLMLLAGYTEKGILPEAHRLNWVCSIVFLTILLLLVREKFINLSFTTILPKVLAYSIYLIAMVPTIFAPAISGSLLILLLSFYINYRTAFVLSILSFIYAISRFYYDLHYTLLTKSFLMFGAGISFLFAYWLTQKNLSTHEKT